MKTKWTIPEDQVEELTKRFVKCVHEDGKGKISLSGFDAHDLMSIYYNIVECHRDLPHYEKNKIVYSALFSAVKRKPLTSNSILSEINDKTIEYLRKPLKRYVLCTSISLPKHLELSDIRINDTVIKFNPHLPEKYAKNAARYLKDGARSLLAPPPNDYLSTRIFVSGRTASDTAKNAFETIDLIRGIWNFGINLETSFKISFGSSERKPINKVLLGPLHTVHDLNGKISEGIWWYDTDYCMAIKPRFQKNDITNMLKIEKMVRKLLKKSNYQNEIEWAFCEYCRSLDQINMTNAFLRLWTVLEKLTNTQTAKYSKTIQRAAFIYAETNYHHAVLNNLRMLRNSFVHANEHNENAETYVYQLKRYVEALLKFHLGKSSIFKNITKATEFLDLSPYKDQILDQIRLRKIAVNYLSR